MDVIWGQENPIKSVILDENTQLLDLFSVHYGLYVCEIPVNKNGHLTYLSSPAVSQILFQDTHC